MIFLAALFVLFLLVATSALAGVERIAVLIDLSGLFCVLALTTGYIAICGYKQFLAGLPAILRRPAESSPEVAGYYRKLAAYTLTCGAGFALTLSVLSTYPMPLLYVGIRTVILTTAIYVFLYSGWLALLLFVPIAFQFADNESRERNNVERPD
jgi:hypothetical protein